MTVKPKGPAGQMLVTFALALAILIALGGLAVDAAGLWWTSEGQADGLSVVRETAMSSENEIKFGRSSATGTLSSVETAAEVVERAVERNVSMPEGGTVDVWVYEMPRDETGDSDRVIGIRLEASGNHALTFAKIMGLSSVPVRSSSAFLIQPYSSREVWRPDYGGDREEFRSVHFTLRAAPGVTGGTAWTSGPRSHPARSSLPADLVRLMEDATPGIR